MSIGADRLSPIGSWGQWEQPIEASFTRNDRRDGAGVPLLRLRAARRPLHRRAVRSVAEVPGKGA